MSFAKKDDPGIIVVDFSAKSTIKVQNANSMRFDGGGGGGMNDIERRVGNLEADVREIKKDTTDIKVDCATIKGDIKALYDRASTLKWLLIFLAGLGVLNTAKDIFLHTAQHAPIASQNQEK